MDEWIKVLGENASKRVASNEGDLWQSVPLVRYNVEYKNSEISLNGVFNIEEMEALTNHMKRYQK